MSLTQQLNIVSTDIHGTAPQAGRHLAVFEIVNHSRIFKGVVPDGQRFQAPPVWQRFRKSPNYVSLAITTNPNLRYSFTQRLLHMEPGHAFDLTFTMLYAVQSPEKLIARLKDDPLECVRKEVERVLGNAVKRTPWEEIRESKQSDNFLALGAELYADGKAELAAFAAELGIELKNVELAFEFTAEDVEPLAAQTKKQRKLLLDAAQDDLSAHDRTRQTASKIAQLHHDKEILHLQHEIELTRQRAQNEITKLVVQKDMLVAGGQAIGKALDNIAGETATGETLVRNVGAIGSMVQGAMLPSPTAASNGSAASDTSISMPLLSSSSSRTELTKIVTEILEQFGSYASTSARGRKFVAAALHWVAELSLGSDADAKALERYKSCIRDSPEDATSAQFILVQKLLNEKELRDRLS